MRINLKLLVIFLVISIIPLFVVGVVSFSVTQQTITEEVLNGLDTVASIQEKRINEIVAKGDEVSAEEIAAIVGGLSQSTETGETLIARKDENGNAVFLHPRRFESAASTLTRISKSRTDVPITQALLKNEAMFAAAVDYRGEAVLAATRYIEALDLGLVVKMDKTEALASIYRLRYLYLNIGLAVLVIVSVLAFITARTISHPLLELTKVAGQLQKGEFSQRSQIRSRDEVGALARAFNSMADRLKLVYEGLEDKVEERTKALALAKAKDEAILENIGDGLVFTDTKNRIVMMNRAAQTMLGWEKQKYLGKQWSDLVKVCNEKGKKIPRSRLPIAKAMLGKNHTATTDTIDDLYYCRRDGSSFPVAITASKVVMNKQTLGAIVVFRDITREKEIDLAKTEFVSLASHQLRTPLSSINWYAEMLLSGDEGKLKKGQKKYVDRIYQGNQRMVGLVNALLSVSRIELGTFAVEPEPTNVVKLAKSVIEELKPQVIEKKLKLEQHFAKKLPILQADPKLLRIIFQNLLSNAAKYTPTKGEISLSVSVKKKGESIDNHKAVKDSIAIVVNDSGMGIPQHQQEKIFTKLFRADNVKETDTDGTGLGLYIIKSIIDHSDGQIWFDSEEGKGTTFYVTIPLKGMRKKVGSKQLA